MDFVKDNTFGYIIFLDISSGKIVYVLGSVRTLKKLSNQYNYIRTLFVTQVNAFGIKLNHCSASYDCFTCFRVVSQGVQFPDGAKSYVLKITAAPFYFIDCVTEALKYQITKIKYQTYKKNDIRKRL